MPKKPALTLDEQCVLSLFQLPGAPDLSFGPGSDHVLSHRAALALLSLVARGFVSLTESPTGGLLFKKTDAGAGLKRVSHKTLLSNPFPVTVPQSSLTG